MINEEYLEKYQITDDGKKRLLQAGFLAGLQYSNSIYTSYKDLEENEREEVINALALLFKSYGLTKEVV